jgi:hypothetical protein
MSTIWRIVTIGVSLLLLTQWLSLDKTRKTYLKSILRQLPWLPGRYAV